jgi:hypothetical protein
VGSIEGRVAVQHVDDNVAQAKNFTFKCHRESSDIYAVNSIAFHPVQGTFATAGTSSCSGCRMLGSRMGVGVGADLEASPVCFK